MSAFLRYFPTDFALHYTAIQVNEGILQIKPFRTQYDSMEDWLRALPGNPPVTALQMEVKPTPTPEPVPLKRQLRRSASCRVS